MPLTQIGPVPVTLPKHSSVAQFGVIIEPTPSLNV